MLLTAELTHSLQLESHAGEMERHFDDSPSVFTHQPDPLIKWRVIRAICRRIINFIPLH